MDLRGLLIRHDPVEDILDGTKIWEIRGSSTSRGPSRLTVTLEAFVDAIQHETPAPWIRELRDRYLGWERIERLIAGG